MSDITQYMNEHSNVNILRFKDSDDESAELIVVVNKSNICQREMDAIEDCITNSFDNSDIDGFNERIIDAMDRVFGPGTYSIPKITNIAV